MFASFSAIIFLKPSKGLDSGLEPAMVIAITIQKREFRGLKDFFFLTDEKKKMGLIGVSKRV
jgi:hypothetical protein